MHYEHYCNAWEAYWFAVFVCAVFVCAKILFYLPFKITYWRSVSLLTYSPYIWIMHGTLDKPMEFNDHKVSQTDTQRQVLEDFIGSVFSMCKDIVVKSFAIIIIHWSCCAFGKPIQLQSRRISSIHWCSISLWLHISLSSNKNDRSLHVTSLLWAKHVGSHSCNRSSQVWCRKRIWLSQCGVRSHPYVSKA